MDKNLRLAWAKWDFVSNNNIIELHTFGGQRSLWRTNRSSEGLCLFPILGWWLFIISHNLESLGKESQGGTVWIRVASGRYHYHIKWSGKTPPHCEWRGGSEPVWAQTLTFTALCSCLWVWLDRFPELLPLRPPTMMNNSLELELKTLFSVWLLLSGYLIRTIRTKLWLHWDIFRHA